MVEVFTHKISSRLLYVLEFIFQDNFRVSDKYDSLKSYDLNYSSQKINAKVQFHPSGLLEQEQIERDLEDGIENEDLLSNIFYVLSRYEEYTCRKKDKFGRFSAVFSKQYQAGKLERPIVDEWVYQIREQLDLAGSFPFQYRPTFDIDNAWAYKNKGWLREFSSKTKDILKGDRKRIEERRDVLRGKKKDPYDTFDQIEKLKPFQPIVFFLLGNYGKYDRNIHWKNKNFQKLIQNVSEYAHIGIHPSFGSFLDEKQLKIEKERLENITGKAITKSRQHFLRMQIPESYSLLEKIGIKEDYTMGYADHVGWRAGTSRSFYFFDLKQNKPLNLKIYPFQYMDGTLNEYQELNVENAQNKINELFQKSKKYGGNFISLWHNETIGNYGVWDQWGEVLNYNISLNE